MNQYSTHSLDDIARIERTTGLCFSSYLHDGTFKQAQRVDQSDGNQQNLGLFDTQP